MQLGKIQEATETYQMALVLNPALVDAHSNLGNLHKASGKNYYIARIIVVCKNLYFDLCQMLSFFFKYFFVECNVLPEFTILSNILLLCNILYFFNALCCSMLTSVL